jgi:hypothetical protein
MISDVVETQRSVRTQFDEIRDDLNAGLATAISPCVPGRLLRSEVRVEHGRREGLRRPLGQRLKSQSSRLKGSRRGSEVEKEANLFAAEVLMPASFPEGEPAGERRAGTRGPAE